MQNTHFSIITKEVCYTKMNASTRAVYDASTLFRRQDNGTCWISQTKLARDLGYSRQTICTAIKNLIKLKLFAFTNKWKHGRYKFYEIFQSAKGHLNRHTRRFASRVKTSLHNVSSRLVNLSEYDHNIKEKIKRKLQDSKKMISRLQFDEIYKKATENIAKNFRFMGNFNKIKNNEFVKTAISDEIRILSESI